MNFTQFIMSLWLWLWPPEQDTAQLMFDRENNEKWLDITYRLHGRKLKYYVRFDQDAVRRRAHVLADDEHVLDFHSGAIPELPSASFLGHNELKLKDKTSL